MPWLMIIFLSLVMLGVALIIHVHVEHIQDGEQDP